MSPRDPRDNETPPGGRPIAEPHPVRRVPPQEDREPSESTGRIQLVARREAESVAGQFERTVKRFRFWVTIVIGLCGAGFLIGEITSHYASKAEVEAHERRLLIIETKLDSVVENLRRVGHRVGAEVKEP